MGQANYWLFNMDYKNNNGDIVWEYCKNNNCFAMQYQDGKQVKSSITKNLNLAREVRVGDYCVAYTGNKTIVGIDAVLAVLIAWPIDCQWNEIHGSSTIHSP